MFCEMFASQESYKCLFIVSCLCAQVYAQYSENDSCLHPSGDPSRCMLMSQCAEATILIERGIKPILCEGQQEDRTLVCCREDTSTPQPLLLIESHDAKNRSDRTSSELRSTGTGTSENTGCAGSACLKSLGMFNPNPQRMYRYQDRPPAFPVFYNFPQQLNSGPPAPVGNFWNSAGRPQRSDWERYDRNIKSFWQNNQNNENIGPSRAAPGSFDVPLLPPIQQRPVSPPETLYFAQAREPSRIPIENHFITFPKPSDNADYRRRDNGGSGFGRLPDDTPKMRISQQMCAEYSSLASTVSLNPLGLFLLPLKDNFRVSVCSKRSVPLIINGVDALPGEFPHMAVLGYLNSNNETDWDCGGSLISDYFVLTAAHCILTTKGRPYVVRLGEHNLFSSEDGTEPRDYGIAEYITYSSYNASQLYDDIALLRLKERVLFGSAIRPACLPSESFTFSSAVATGWGLTDIGGDRSDVLQKVLLSPIPNVRCSRAYSVEALTSKLYKGIDHSSQMCYGEFEGRDTAQGDSGGPLQVSDDNCNYYVVGVTSFGKYYGKKRSAGVYTRVQNYLDWIESVVWPNS